MTAEVGAVRSAAPPVAGGGIAAEAEPGAVRAAGDGWSWQVQARRAMVRDDGVVVGWVKEVWPCAEDSRRPVEPGSSSRTKPDSPWHRRT